MKLTKTQALKLFIHPQFSELSTSSRSLIVLVSNGSIVGGDIPSLDDDATAINAMLQRKAKPALLAAEDVIAKREDLLNFLFIVYAHSGRFNGWALVTANNKTEARKFARQSGWLTRGTVDSAVTLREYLEDMGDDVEEGFAEMIAEFPECNVVGHVVEIEWGT